MKIILTGAHGLIGVELIAALQKREHDLVVLRRSRSKGKAATREVLWDPAKRDAKWMSEFDGADAVINLSGESIAGKRWSPEQKKVLRESRVFTTRAVVDAIASAPRKPKVLVNASAIGFYGPRDERPITEHAGPGGGFLVDLCREWEGEASRASSMNVRVVFLRTGLVLSKKGGALAKMLPPFQLGLGGPLGSGRQGMSWIHIDDEVAAIVEAVENRSLYGPLNLTAPEPVSMKEFAATLGRVLGRPAIFPVPGFVLKLALGEMAMLLLTGQRVLPEKLEHAGFRFKFPALEPALRDLLSRPKSA